MTGAGGNILTKSCTKESRIDDSPPSLLEMLGGMRKRLKRRNVLLDEVRKAYLKDVVVVRDLLSRQECKPSTSLNLHPTLALYAPSECTFRVAHGGKLDDYGGHVEIIHRESKRVAELSKRIEELLELEQESRYKAAKLEVQAQQDRSALNNQRSYNRDERDQLCAEISMLKDRLDRLDETALESAQRTINGLQRQLEHSEARIKDLVPLVSDTARSQQEAGQAGLLLAGKDHRIVELENTLTAAKCDLCHELDRYNDLEIKLSAECAGSQMLQRKHDDIFKELHGVNLQWNSTQGSLDESRRSEAELRQKLSDLQVEYTEAVQREEAEQEELRLQLESAREQVRLAKNELDDVKVRLVRSEMAQQEALSKACMEVEQQMKSKHQHEIQQLKDELVRYDEKLIKVDVKLKLEQEKRAMIDVELRGLRVEEQQHVQTVSDLTKETNASINEILTSLGFHISEPNSIIGSMKLVSSRIVELLATIERLEKENHALVIHLDQYKAKSDAASSSAKLVSLISVTEKKKTFSNEQLIQMLQENADGLSQIQTELDIVVADRDRIEVESKQILKHLESTRSELHKLAAEHEETRRVRAIAQVDLRTEIFAELDRGRITSLKCDETLVEIADIREKSSELQAKLVHFQETGVLHKQSSPDDDMIKKQKAPSDTVEKVIAPAKNVGIEKNNADQEIHTQLISVTSLLSDAVQQISGLEGPKVAASEVAHPEDFDITGKGNTASQILVLSTQFTSAMENFCSELSSLRMLTNTLPTDFSYSENLAKITMLEQAVKEAGDGESGKKGGREEELQRLKQRNASQQNFIMELQEEVATMKGLMFAADEIKRQYSELEDKYRLLENEFTEKAENEVNSRKAKERIELQLTLAHADIASLTREKESLVVTMKNNEDLISKLELKLMHTQRVYEDVVQHERMRLETNRDIGTQFSPMLLDINVQTSFKTPGMTLRQINSFAQVPHRKWGTGRVTAAIADCRTMSDREFTSQKKPSTPGISQQFSSSVSGYRPRQATETPVQLPKLTR